MKICFFTDVQVCDFEIEFLLSIKRNRGGLDEWIAFGIKKCCLKTNFKPTFLRNKKLIQFQTFFLSKKLFPTFEGLV